MKKIINSLKKHLNKKNLLKILREREAVDNVGEKYKKDDEFIHLAISISSKELEEFEKMLLNNKLWCFYIYYIEVLKPALLLRGKIKSD